MHLLVGTPLALTRIAFYVCSAFHDYFLLHFSSHRLCHRRRNHRFQFGQIALFDRKKGRIKVVGHFTPGQPNDQLINNKVSVIFGPTDAAMGHCAHSFDVHFNSYATPAHKYRGSKYSRMAPGPRKPWKFSLRII